MKTLINLILSLFGLGKKHQEEKAMAKEILAEADKELKDQEEILEKQKQALRAVEDMAQYETENQVNKVVHDPKVPDPVPPVEFKTDRVMTEYHNDLLAENPDLFYIVEDLNKWVQKTFKKKTILTMIFRTEAEQDYLYRNSAKYKRRKFKSPHQFYHAVDIRSFIFTKAEIGRIERYLNKKYNERNYYRWTAKCHEVGNNGMHFHIQFCMKAGLKKKGEKIL